jgi:hypothetical protein
MNVIPKKRTRSNPNPSSSKEIERRSSDETRGEGITMKLPEDMISLP